MANVINSVVQENYDVKQQLGDLPDVTQSLKRFQNRVNIRRLFTKQFVLDPADSFVLGSPTNAILGTSRLGDRRVELNNFVYPYNNIIEEDLDNYLFIDENNTDAVVENEKATFNSGDVLLSLVTAKINAPINNCKITDLDNDGDLTIEVSNDNGVNWHTVTKNQTFFFPETDVDNQFVYRLTATTGTTTNAPIKIQINKG